MTPERTPEEMAKEAITNAKVFGCDWEEWLPEEIAKLITAERQNVLRLEHHIKETQGKAMVDVAGMLYDQDEELISLRAENSKLKEELNKKKCVHCQEFPACRIEPKETFYGVLDCGCSDCDCKGEENARS